MNKALQHARSYLFVPANRVERYEKALKTQADHIIIDLEDAVPVELKHSARESLRLWLIENPTQKIMIRVNSKNSEWFSDDIQLALFNNVDGIVLPKTESGSDVEAITKLAKIDVFPLIETAKGFAQVRLIAATPNVLALMFGSIDFQLEMAMDGGYYELLSFRNEIVLASKLAGIGAPIDGVTVDFKNLSLVTQESLEAKKLGFSGKLCIHPDQVNIVNQAFSPSESEIGWANLVLEKVSLAQGQAVSLDGKMIDLPIINKAQKVLQHAEQNRQLDSKSGR